MCILFLALGQHEDFPLIVATNRDEFHQRPSSPMHYWPDHPGILAGRDDQAGGTWLGVSKAGRFCAVTNLRTGTPLNPTARTRGELIPGFLDSDPDSAAFPMSVSPH